MKDIIQKRIIPVEAYQNLSTLVSNIKGEPGRAWQISFVQYNTLWDLFGFEPTVIQDEYKLSDYLVDRFSFDNLFLECKTARRMIFKGRRSIIIHNFKMDVHPGYKCLEKFRRGLQLFMMESNDFILNISFVLKVKMDIWYLLMVNQKLLDYQSENFIFMSNKSQRPK